MIGWMARAITTAVDPYEPSSGGDELTSGGGDDLIVPEAYASGELDGDTVLYVNSHRGVRVDLRAGTARGQGADDLRIRGPISLQGSRHEDVLKGMRFAEVFVGLGGRPPEWSWWRDELFGIGATSSATLASAASTIFSAVEVTIASTEGRSPTHFPAAQTETLIRRTQRQHLH